MKSTKPRQKKQGLKYTNVFFYNSRGFKSGNNAIFFDVLKSVYLFVVQPISLKKKYQTRLKHRQDTILFINVDLFCVWGLC